MRDTSDDEVGGMYSAEFARRVGQQRSCSSGIGVGGPAKRSRGGALKTTSEAFGAAPMRVKSLSWVTGDAGDWYLAVENLIDDLIVKQSSHVDCRLQMRLTLTIRLETRPCLDDAKAENRVVICLSIATGQRRRAWSDKLMSMIESEIAERATDR